MKIKPLDALISDLADVLRSMQEHPEQWDDAARDEATIHVADLHSLAEVIANEAQTGVA
jgi:hypothetical protein